jgi:outer membrane lipoprotein-sorting protein
MLRTLFLLFVPISLFAQSNLNDKEAGALLQASAAKYKQYKTLTADFTLTIIRPKQKPEESDAKYTETQTGKVWLKGDKFKLSLMGNEIFCDGKNIWTCLAKSKECQLNDYIESDEIFSPGKIFDLYQAGYAYQIKEKKNYGAKAVTVIEMAPSNRKVSFFKIDVGLDDATKEVLEVKVYEKNGTRYIYKLDKVETELSLIDSFFTFDNKKNPSVKVIDLR